MAERLSLSDGTFHSAYEVHAQRYRFAARWCVDKRVLDAACGVGYGSRILRDEGADAVLGVDVDAGALAEAERSFARPGVTFRRADLGEGGALSDLGLFGTVVSFETLEHVPDADRLLDNLGGALEPGGTLIISTPNGAVPGSVVNGRPANPFHVREYFLDEFRSLLAARFEVLEMHAQWASPQAKNRDQRARETFDHLSALYYSPGQRAWRVVRRLLGKGVLPPPEYTGLHDAYLGDYVWADAESWAFPWEPIVYVAVCRAAETGPGTREATRAKTA